MVTKKYFILCAIFLLINSSNVLSRSKKESNKKNQMEQAEAAQFSRYKERVSAQETSAEPSIKDKAQDWIKHAWEKTKSLFAKTTKSIATTVEKNIERPENETHKKWHSSHAHQKATLKQQKIAHKAEELINMHCVDSAELLAEIEESSDQQFKKYTRQYHRQAEKGKREAESGRKDLEFALRNVAKESAALQKTNENNLEQLKLYKNDLLEYQREVKKQTRHN